MQLLLSKWDLHNKVWPITLIFRMNIPGLLYASYLVLLMNRVKIENYLMVIRYLLFSQKPNETSDTKKQLNFVSHTCTHCRPILENAVRFLGALSDDIWNKTVLINKLPPPGFPGGSLLEVTCDIPITAWFSFLICRKDLSYRYVRRASKSWD